ncbi:Sir2 family [Fragilaria crotonensis]|nr:Sir2 family [Fragilaria crotonensis]
MSSQDGVSSPPSGPPDRRVANGDELVPVAAQDISEVATDGNSHSNRRLLTEAMPREDAGDGDEERPANVHTGGHAQESCDLFAKQKDLVLADKLEGHPGEESKCCPNVPISHCPHVRSHILLQHEQLPTSTNVSCTECIPKSDDSVHSVESNEETAQNWLCLQCGVVFCSPDDKAHGLAHYQVTSESDPGDDKAGHCIAANLQELSVWCHACQAYLSDPLVDELTEKLKALNCRAAPQTNEEDVDGSEESSSDEDSNSESSQDDPRSEQGVRRMIASIFGDEDERVYPFGRPPRSLSDVARFILSDECQSIAILAGAGMSVASGIPDFRSAGGLYDTLRPGLLTASLEEREAIRADPTFALDMNLFLQNPLPCLELNRPFILGTRDRLWKATLAHRFVELLHIKTGKLTRLYQQNIDGLEGQCTNLPREKVVMVHGSMDEAECALCKTKSDFQGFCTLVEKNIKDLTGKDQKAPNSSTPIACQLCGYEAMKPSIVLFRSSLPGEFFRCVREDLPGIDL